MKCGRPRETSIDNVVEENTVKKTVENKDSGQLKKLNQYTMHTLLGALVGLLGSVLCAFACELRSLALLAVGAAFAGIGLSHAQNYRFGATLCVPDASKAPIAISWVLAGGIIGAIVGPVPDRISVS